MIVSSTPLADRFIMPAEFSPHFGTVLIFPVRAGSWGNQPLRAQRTFARIAQEILKSEEVFVLVNEADLPFAETIMPQGVHFQVIPTDDSWARDTMPTFVKRGECVRAVNWSFNAWGGTVDGLYADWQADDRAAEIFAERNGYAVYDASPFVLEGGSVHSDGEGTLLVTEACLLSKGRNPLLTKSQIEEKLKTYLGVQKIIWLPHGIYNDETNEHVDNVCAFIRPAEVVLAWTDDQADPQYAMSQADRAVLERETDAKGRKFIVHRLPVPDHPVLVTREDVEGFTFEEGEDTREVGERLAASYVNFYITNDSVLLPQFGGENIASDRRAVEIMTKLMPERKIVPIDSLVVLKGGGNIHCITQQIPKGEER